MEHQALIDGLRKKGIRNERVLDAMLNNPREQFVEKGEQDEAYADHPLSIGYKQTISQPYIVALMTEALLGGRDSLHKALEIGTGSGYQAAILSVLVDEVYTVERIEALYQRARDRLAALGLDNVYCLYGDGNEGWVPHAPYDGIIVTSAAPTVPEALLAQLAMGGRLVIPVDELIGQTLYVIEHTKTGFEKTKLSGVRFVPLLKGTE